MDPRKIAARLVLTALVLLSLRVPARGQEPLVAVTAEGAGVLTLLVGDAPASVELQGRPHNLALSPGGKRVWVTDASASKVWVVEVGSRTATAVPIQGINACAGQRIRISAKVASTDEARLAGFQCATADEIRRTVIVFDFHREVLGEFHTQNVPAPLDIAFVKGSGRIFSILRMDPSPRARYGPLGAYRYAIEARAGFFKERGISAGDGVMLVESRIAPRAP